MYQRKLPGIQYRLVGCVDVGILKQRCDDGKCKRLNVYASLPAQRQYDQKLELVSITHGTSEETHYVLRQIALDLPLGLILVVKQVLDGFYP